MSTVKAHAIETPTENKSVKKLVVAIHGIGSQFRYATIQSVATSFSIYCGGNARPPLGSFHPKPPLTAGILPFESKKIPEALRGLGFAEVFWADIPQQAVEKRDTLEETKAWAKTVVARVRALDCAGDHRPTVDYKKASSVVAEMVETIGVLESLLFLADKCGLVKFDLASLLTDYLGDVQIVTEFVDYRERILSEFHRIMKELTENHPDVEEVYIIAHSEGTVVSFIGLLQALSGQVPEEVRWNVGKVRGYMTLGSPIDKHIVMWPDLWKNLTAPQTTPSAPIKWRNYYDNGDPVGYELNTARDWLQENKWIADQNTTSKEDYFEFTNAHECGFTRYPLPGKAHNDYWEDQAVFAHFIGDVIEKKPVTKPRTRQYAWAISWIVPYVLCLALLFGGVYLLYKVTGKLIGDGSTGWEIFRNVGSIATLLGGMTVMARMPRLTKFFPWHLIAAAIFGLSVWAFQAWIVPTVSANLGLFFDQHFGWPGEKAFIGVVAVIGLIAALSAKFMPGTGLKPLMILSGLMVTVVTYAIVTGPGVSDQPLWPVVLAGAGFLYLWWLAALLFDLVFVWHHYIRWGAGMTALKKIRKAHHKDAQLTRPRVTQLRTAPAG